MIQDTSLIKVKLWYFIKESGREQRKWLVYIEELFDYIYGKHVQNVLLDHKHKESGRAKKWLVLKNWFIYIMASI